MSLNPTPLNDDNMATNSPQTLITKTDKEIYFYGPLTDESCFRLHYTLEELIKINKDKNNEIDLYLQTGGGSVLPTFPVVDLIKSSEIPINTIIKGYCASAGTLISVAGSKRYMTNNSLLLIHSLRQETGGGTFNNIKDTFENSDVIMKLIKNIYLENTEIPEEKLNYFFDHDLWLTCDECLKLKIVDGIKN
jgi:ATP-dependent Clp protease protease subunit